MALVVSERYVLYIRSRKGEMRGIQSADMSKCLHLLDVRCKF